MYKVVIIGDTNVGKTSVLMKFAENVFPDSPNATVGLDFKTRIITAEGSRIKLNIVDTGGQEKFRDLTSGFFRHSHGIIVMFDITHQGSFSNVKNWVRTSNDHNCEQVPKIVVGNKLDLASKRTVSKEDAEKLANELGTLLRFVFTKERCSGFNGSNAKVGFPYSEVSAKTGDNIDQIFHDLAVQMVKKFPAKSNMGNGTVAVGPTNTRDKKEKCKC